MGRQGLRWVLDVDISKYYDTIQHHHLRTFLDRRVTDGVIRRMIDKWLKAGVLEYGLLQRTTEGTPQGGVVSPLLANIYLHHVLDEWFERDVRVRLRGNSILVRYADDSVMAFETLDDAKRVMDVLGKRLARYGSRSTRAKRSSSTFAFIDRGPPPSGYGQRHVRLPRLFPYLGQVEEGLDERVSLALA
jgi:retron-type reverse transcriptase